MSWRLMPFECETAHSTREGKTLPPFANRFLDPMLCRVSLLSCEELLDGLIQ